MTAPEARIVDHLRFLYPEAAPEALWTRLRARLEAFRAAHPELRQPLPPEERLTERDAILITYGDQVTEPGRAPLATLADVLTTYAGDVISGVHILPFFPYSSDDGFSVIDYMTVNPEWGDWEDVERIGAHFRLMFDAVINHISRRSAWFQGFLAGDPQYKDFFITVEPGTDLSDVVRPRAKPLLTPVETAEGEKLVWTTFSPDQIDLNFANPEVLLRIVDVLLCYVEHGVEIIRLDAIAYLWKEIGTPCIHLEQTHRVVQLFRAILDLVAPNVMLITETNVPHAENISYFGDGTNEAQLVYQFSLPPLVLHALARGDASYLTTWAAGLAGDLSSKETTFYNFLASHDGVGVRPVEGILPPEEVQWLAARAKAHGGYVSYKANADGSQSPYELNISYFDALSDPQGREPLGLQVQRFMVSQAIMLALQGVPAIYVHSFFGSRNYPEGVEKTERYRSINRQKFRRAELEAALADPNTVQARVYHAYHRLLSVRREHPAFHPVGAQRVLDLGPAVFALTRTAPKGDEVLLCLHNVTAEPQTLELQALDLGAVEDVIGGEVYPPEALTLGPYQILWLRPTRNSQLATCNF
ncbi:MAG: alpha-amylase family glycosyl hydrolase [Anaerolineae bacterium]